LSLQENAKNNFQKDRDKKLFFAFSCKLKRLHKE